MIKTGPSSPDGIRMVKHDFSASYNRDWPHSYLKAHLALDYIIPDRAKPVFLSIFDRYRSLRQKDRLKIIDIGCSYGINAALLRTDMSLDDLYAAYAAEDGPLAGRRSVDHRAFFESRSVGADLHIVGVDPSERAARYARSVGLVDAIVTTDLERTEPTVPEKRALEGADIIISTGSVGYATERTFARIYAAARISRPWVAAFVMHPYSYTDIATMLASHGLQSREVLAARQRRFSTASEQHGLLEVMQERGFETRLERTTGYIYASFHLSALPDEMPDQRHRP
ncbi:hypothetical protein [Labrys sp. 22185]|uniref:hypothetical protein n=1 Tax=Labrys sp. 22185 TaxID=3453888 RepID=UPI003F851D94